MPSVLLSARASELLRARGPEGGELRLRRRRRARQHLRARRGTILRLKKVTK